MIIKNSKINSSQVFFFGPTVVDLFAFGSGLVVRSCRKSTFGLLFTFLWPSVAKHFCSTMLPRCWKILRRPNTNHTENEKTKKLRRNRREAGAARRSRKEASKDSFNLFENVSWCLRQSVGNTISANVRCTTTLLGRSRRTFPFARAFFSFSSTTSSSTIPKRKDLQSHSLAPEALAKQKTHFRGDYFPRWLIDDTIWFRAGFWLFRAGNCRCSIAYAKAEWVSRKLIFVLLSRSLRFGFSTIFGLSWVCAFNWRSFSFSSENGI